MKKAYIKPQFLVENFALTQQIAQCNGIRISSTNQACVFKDPDSTPQMKQIAHQGGFMGGCVWSPEYQTNDGLCYMQNVHMVFASN